MTVVLTVIDNGSSSDSNNFQIFQAIESNNLEQAKLLIESGSDVNLTQQDGISLLECAVIQSSINMVKLLLSAGAKPDHGFQSPLKQAIFKEQPDIVQALIDAGANVNLLLENQETPLIHAASVGNLEIVKILVEAGADAKVISEHEDHALLLAAASGHRDIFDYLSPFVLPKQQRQAQRALESGIREKQRKQDRLVEKLVDAAGLGNLKQVQEAIADKVDVNGIGSGGSTALYQASWWGRTRVLKELIASGADIELQHEEDQFTPLLSAVRMATSSSVFLLLKAGANPNAMTKNGIYTPLIMGADTYIVGIMVTRL
jgi:ankyrin repeat protein